ncbi:MAG: hypothetical protein JWO62_2622 [Acidimicrobiaceae bacterium]|nr:hypothetical protein [Acidimicrobiaceae bacterium]
MRLAQAIVVDDTVAYRAVVTAPDGTVVYDGPAPIPSEYITITPEMALRGEMFSVELYPDGPSARCN